MKNKKHFLLIVTILTFFIATVFTVFAHPGRTDQNGGHWDRESGTYHFHSGEHAGRNSSDSSSSSEYVPFTPPYDPPTDNPYKQDNSSSDTTKESNSFWDIVSSILWSTFVFGFAVYIITTISKFTYDVCLEKHHPKHKINALIKKINEFQQQQTELAEINMKVFEFELNFKIPDSYEIGCDNLPKDKDCIENWGESFTLYKTDKGTKLHKKYNCCSANISVHIYWYRRYRTISDFLCRKCAGNYITPDMSWYEDYLKYKNAKTKCQRIENSSKQLQQDIKVLYVKCNSAINRALIFFSPKSQAALQEANKNYNEIQTEIHTTSP